MAAGMQLHYQKGLGPADYARRTNAGPGQSDFSRAGMNRGAGNAFDRLTASDIQTQAEITWNAAVQPETADYRARTIQDLEKKSRFGYRTMGTKLGFGKDAVSFMHMFAGELAISYRRSAPTEMSKLVESKRAVFTCLNGIEIEPNDTQFSFEQRYPIVGVVASDYLFNKPEQIEAGCSVRSMGSSSTFHTGNDIIFPMDYVTYRYPSIDVLKREEQDLSIPHNEDILMGRHVPILEVYSFKRLFLFAESAMQRWCSSKTPSDRRFINLQPGAPSKLNSPEAELGSAIAYDKLTTAALAVITLHQLGIVEIKSLVVPGALMTSVGTPEYEKLISRLADHIGTGKINEYFSDVSASDPSLPVYKKADEAEKLALCDRARLILTLFDLAPHEPSNRAGELPASMYKFSDPLKRLIVGRTSRGIIASAELHKEFNMEPAFIASESYRPHRNYIKGSIEEPYDRSTLAGQVGFLANSGPKYGIEYYAQCKRFLDSKVLFMALKHTRGGGKLDYAH